MGNGKAQSLFTRSLVILSFKSSSNQEAAVDILLHNSVLMIFVGEKAFSIVGVANIESNAI
jgi:hypothetical protein